MRWSQEVSRGLADRFVEAKAKKWRRRGLSACAVREEVCPLFHCVSAFSLRAAGAGGEGVYKAKRRSGEGAPLGVEWVSLRGSD